MSYTEKTDTSLETEIQAWVKESTPYHDYLLKHQDRMVAYYEGNQTDRDDVPAFQSNTVYNRIFEATETVIPIVTGTSHQFLAIPATESTESLTFAKNMQKVLTRKFEDLEMVRLLEDCTRDVILKRFGVLKWFWNHEKDDVDVKVIDPRLILIPKLRVDANDLPYVIEIQEYTEDDIKSFFPDVIITDLKKGTSGDISISSHSSYEEVSLTETYQILEVTTRETISWFQEGTVLKTMENPYFQFIEDEESEEDTSQNGKIIRKKFDFHANHLDSPVLNYVFINPFRTGDAPVSRTSIGEVSLPIQDDINNQKRRIGNNLATMGNGQVVADSDAITEEQRDAITSEPGLVITGKNLASENRIKREPGVPLPSGHFANLQDSSSAFDNVFGTHAAIRGQGSNGTLGGQILSNQQDASRIEQLTRSLNRAIARVADGIVQMMKSYYDETKVFRILGKEGAVEFIRITSNDIEKGLTLNVKSGVPPTLDPVARFNQGIQLWQLNAIDPETMFERLDFPDPAESAQKLFAWKSGQLLLESQLKQKEAEQGAEISSRLEAEKQRGVETSNNVVARSAKNISQRGSTKIKNTPKGGNADVQQ